MLRRSSAVVVILLLLLGAPAAATAQESRQLRWDRYDVTIDLRPDGSFRVCEQQDITFVRGSFSTGSRVIPLGRVTDIREVQVVEAGRPYRAGDGQQPNTFSARREDNNLRIAWAYPSTSGRTRAFEICYTVLGGLAILESSAQLQWKAVFGDRPFPVTTSTTTVRLPQPVAPAKLIARSFNPSVRGTIVDPQTVRFEAGSVPANQEVEIGLEFPRDLVATSVPAWQAMKPYQDLANLALGGLALLLLVGGGLGLLGLWYTRGRDLPVGKVAEYLREPPDDLPPAVVGTLLDEQADVQDVLATIPWLGSRGVLHLSEVTTEALPGSGRARDYLFQRLAGAGPLRPYEETIMQIIFHGGDEAYLSRLRGQLMSSMPLIQQQLYAEVVQQGYFDANPAATRARYRAGGFAIIGLAIVLGLVAAPSIASFASWVYLPLFPLAFIGLLLALTSRAMPRRTRKGALAAAKWNAFRRYLEQIERYEQLDQAKAIFERYLPYATVFGLERSWVRKFAEVGVTPPAWYGPGTVIYEPGYGYRHGGYSHHPGYGAGYGGVTGFPSADSPVEAAPSGGGFDVQGSSDRVFDSLQVSSDQLLDMFDSASQIFGGSDGGGSWGGGDGGDGGGGGGGGSGGYE